MLAPPAAKADESGSAQARALALAAPVLLLGGALLFQYIGGLYPCEMCWWQRYPHAVAIVLAALAFTSVPSASRARAFTGLAALVIAVSGLIGAYHAGVEYGWWKGLTTCTTNGPATIDDIMKIPLIRCDQVQWSIAGISLAGFNAVFSLCAAAVIGWLLMRSRGAAR